MRISRFLRISLLALAASTAVVSPGFLLQSGAVLAAANPSSARPSKPRGWRSRATSWRRARRPSAPAIRRPIKLVELIYLRDHPNDAGYQRILAFLDIAPKWPLSEALLKRAERSLYVNNEPPN